MTVRPRVQVAAVVIGRDVADHLQDVLDAARSLACMCESLEVVYVDSQSGDRSVEIACERADAVYRYQGNVRSAAAGRAVGTVLSDSAYILYLDGDSVIHGEWFADAMEYMQARPGCGAVYGGRKEEYQGVSDGFVSTGPAMEEYGLGGNALYRREAIEAAGGFHPYLISDEERELAQRVLAKGYSIDRIDGCMITHRTVPKDTVAGFRRRIARGMVLGEGQVLRTSLGTPALGAHLRYSDRKLLMLLYLASGLATTVYGAVSGRYLATGVWVVLGVAAFALLVWKRRSLRGAATILGDWVAAGLGGLLGFVRGVPVRESFDPIVEPLQPAAEPFRLRSRVVRG